ncbi:MAG: hypothetical protein QM784_37370 [Polyangiaceae bacterium]
MSVDLESNNIVSGKAIYGLESRKRRAGVGVTSLLLITVLALGLACGKRRNTAPEGARAVDVAFLEIVDDTSWTQRLEGRPLPDNMSLSKNSIPTSHGGVASVEVLEISPVDESTLRQAVDDTRRWASTNVKLKPDEHFALAWELERSHLIAYIFKGSPVLTLPDVRDALAVPASSESHWSVSTTFNRSGVEKLMRLQREQPTPRIAVAIEDLIRFGPVTLGSVPSNGAISLDLGSQGTKATAELLAVAFQGELYTKNPHHRW